MTLPKNCARRRRSRRAASPTRPPNASPARPRVALKTARHAKPTNPLTTAIAAMPTRIQAALSPETVPPSRARARRPARGAACRSRSRDEITRRVPVQLSLQLRGMLPPRLRREGRALRVAGASALRRERGGRVAQGRRDRERRCTRRTAGRAARRPPRAWPPRHRANATRKSTRGRRGARRPARRAPMRDEEADVARRARRARGRGAPHAPARRDASALGASARVEAVVAIALG